MTGMTRCPSGHRLDDQDPVPPLTASHVGLKHPDGCRHVDGQDRGSTPCLGVYHGGSCTTEMDGWNRCPGAGQLAGSNAPFKTRTNEGGDVELSGFAHMSRESRAASPERRDRLYEIDCQASGNVSKRPSLAYDLGDSSTVGLIDISQHRENPLSQPFIDGSSPFRTPPRFSPTHTLEPPSLQLAPAVRSSATRHRPAVCRRNGIASRTMVPAVDIFQSQASAAISVSLLMTARTMIHHRKMPT